MINEIEELYQTKRSKYKEVDEELDKVLYAEAVKETAVMEGINAKARELMKG